MNWASCNDCDCDFYFLMTFLLNFIDNKTVFNGRMILLMDLLNLIGININYVFTLTFMEKKNHQLKMDLWKMNHFQSCFMYDYALLVSYHHL